MIHRVLHAYYTYYTPTTLTTLTTLRHLPHLLHLSHLPHLSHLSLNTLTTLTTLTALTMAGGAPRTIPSCASSARARAGSSRRSTRPTRPRAPPRYLSITPRGIRRATYDHSLPSSFFCNRHTHAAPPSAAGVASPSYHPTRYGHSLQRAVQKEFGGHLKWALYLLVQVYLRTAIAACPTPYSHHSQLTLHT